MEHPKLHERCFLRAKSAQDEEATLEAAVAEFLSEIDDDSEPSVQEIQDLTSIAAALDDEIQNLQERLGLIEIEAIRERRRAKEDSIHFRDFHLKIISATRALDRSQRKTLERAGEVVETEKKLCEGHLFVLERVYFPAVKSRDYSRENAAAQMVENVKGLLEDGGMIDKLSKEYQEILR